MDTSENLPTPPSRPTYSRWILGLVVIILIAASFQVGYSQGKAGFKFDPKSFKVINRNDTPQDVDYSLLWTAIEKLKANHIDQPKDDLKILYGAVKGAVSSVDDPYTAFFTPEELASFKTDLSGKFDGIGAEIGKRDGAIVVIALRWHARTKSRTYAARYYLQS
jgi:carboxyl-terminal processing protease